jgi:hypothetical protein
VKSGSLFKAVKPCMDYVALKFTSEKTKTVEKRK